MRVAGGEARCRLPGSPGGDAVGHADRAAAAVVPDDGAACICAGQGVGSVAPERTVREVTEEIAEGAEALLRRW